MRYISFHLIALIFIVSCKNRSGLKNEFDKNLSTHEKIQTKMLIDSIEYAVDSVNCFKMFHNEFNQDYFRISIFITAAINDFRPGEELKKAYIEINCLPKEGAHYFTKLDERNFPYSYYYTIAKVGNGVTTCLSHRVDPSGLTNKIFISNFDSINNKFDLEYFGLVKIKMHQPGRKISLKIINLPYESH